MNATTAPSFEIIDNFELPVTANTRTREKGDFSLAVDSLDVGQGFYFDSTIPHKAQYARVSPRKFGGKHFTVVQISEGKFAVKRKS